MPFETVSDALRQADREISKGNYRTAMGICSSAITFFNPASIECVEALKTKVKIIKAFASNDLRLVDNNQSSYRP